MGKYITQKRPVAPHRAREPTLESDIAKLKNLNKGKKLTTEYIRALPNKGQRAETYKT